MNLLQRHKKEIILLIIIFLIMIFIASMHITLFSDEAFSLGLIRFHINKLIYFDSLDVHPPLYYLLLKVFLYITTFYTKNFYIKILFSRIFSLILSIMTFIVLYNINNYLDLRIKLWKQIVIFILLGFLPYIYVPISNFLIIRMYPLAALCVVIQFYEIVQFKFTNNISNLVLMLLFAILSFYTHYISAIISGLIILITFLNCLYHCDKNKCLKLFIIGIISIITYTPWILVAIHQVDDVAGGNWWMNNKEFIINILLMIVIIIVFAYAPIKYFNVLNNKCKFVINLLFSTLGTLLVMVTIISFIKHPMFQAKYAYPILLLYSFISLSIFNKYEQKDVYIYLIAIFLFLGNFYNFALQIHSYDLPTINVLRTVNNIRYDKYVKLNDKVRPSSQYMTEVMYCKYNNKYIKNYKHSNLLKTNPKLYKSIFFN